SLAAGVHARGEARPIYTRCPKVAQFLDVMREAGGADTSSAFSRLLACSRNLLSGAARLDTYLTMLERT
ncbi:hypothetical protein ABZ293_41600, partial [Nocardia sp. NPDC005998]